MAGKTLKTMFFAVVIIAAVAALLLALCVLAPHGTAPQANTNNPPALNPVNETVSNATNTLINAAIDTSGVKTAAENALLSYSNDISKQTGLANNQVKSIIEDMDIQSWEVTDLPADATQDISVSGTYAGVNATITTYDDPNYVSVNACGQDLTLSVPASAQKYLPLIAFAN